MTRDSRSLKWRDFIRWSIFLIGIVLFGGLLAGCDAAGGDSPPRVVGVYEDKDVRITVTSEEVVSSRQATLDAFCRAVRTTFAGSMTPSATRSP